MQSLVGPDPSVYLRSDQAATRLRYERLQKYMSGNVLSDTQFVCNSECSCRGSLSPGIEFVPGQLSHVGKHYDVAVAEVPFRILVVPMDTGRRAGDVTMDARRMQVYDSASLSFNVRNPHMRGTTLALRAWFGREAWDQPADEFLRLGGRNVHLFDAYAMANVRLCSAVRPGSTKSKGTATMSRNCLRHLRATLDALDPQLVVLQGTRIRESVAPLIGRSEAVTPELERVELAGVSVLMASFQHPSYPRWIGNWSWPSSPYFLKTVLPTVQRARRIALEPGRPA